MRIRMVLMATGIPPSRRVRKTQSLTVPEALASPRLIGVEWVCYMLRGVMPLSFVFSHVAFFYV